MHDVVEAYRHNWLRRINIRVQTPVLLQTPSCRGRSLISVSTRRSVSLSPQAYQLYLYVLSLIILLYLHCYLLRHKDEPTSNSTECVAAQEAGEVQKSYLGTTAPPPRSLPAYSAALRSAGERGRYTADACRPRFCSNSLTGFLAAASFRQKWHEVAPSFSHIC